MNLLYQTIISLLKILIRSKFFLPKITVSEDQVMILGNGPSAALLLDSDERNKITVPWMCVNMFASTHYFIEVKPKYYLMSDHAFYEFTEENFINPETHHRIKEDPAYLITQTQVNATWVSLLQSDWGLQIWVPQLYRNSFIVKRAIQMGLTIHLYNYTVVKGFNGFENFIYKKGLGSPQSQNVINSCIFQAINSGFRQISLMGIDNNFHLCIQVAEDNSLHFIDDHFYKTAHKTVPLMKKDKNGNLTGIRIHEQFMSLHKAFYAYTRLREYADYRKVKVFNITKGSFVDAFERKPISALFE